MVPTSMTLNDFERPYFAFISPNSIALQADDVTVVEDRFIMSVKYCLPVPVFHFWRQLIQPCSPVSAIAEHLVRSIGVYGKPSPVEHLRIYISCPGPRPACLMLILACLTGVSGLVG